MKFHLFNVNIFLYAFLDMGSKRIYNILGLKNHRSESKLWKIHFFKILFSMIVISTAWKVILSIRFSRPFSRNTLCRTHDWVHLCHQYNSWMCQHRHKHIFDGRVFCQAQPSQAKLQLQLRLRLALFLILPTHPHPPHPGKYRNLKFELRQPQGKKTSMEDNFMEDNLKWKTTSMEDNLNRRRPQCKTTI